MDGRPSISPGSSNAAGVGRTGEVKDVVYPDFRRPSKAAWPHRTVMPLPGVDDDTAGLPPSLHVDR